MSSQKHYISDEIGDDYKKWGRGDTIFLTAPTGSGKTYFVLYELLEWASIQNQTVTLLVNRSVLRDQILSEIHNLPNGKARSSIILTTYQDLEMRLRTGDSYNPNSLIAHIRQSSYIVCDESHYFSMDSLFNSHTEISYSFIHSIRGDHTTIFISATLECIRKRLENDFCLTYPVSSPRYNIKINARKLPRNRQQDSIIPRISMDPKVYEYSIPQDYSWINPILVSDIEDLCLQIINSKEKWLIFVDSIAKGQEIQKKLENRSESIKVCLLYSAYWNESEEAWCEMNHIVDNERQSSTVLIATSVMDNGVSLKDTELRNMVINTDSREELIQMLGRKRISSPTERIDLYLVCKSKEQITRRLNNLLRIRDSLETYSKRLEQLAGPYNAIVSSDQMPEALDQLIKGENKLIWEMHMEYLNLIVETKLFQLSRVFYVSEIGNLILNRFAFERIREQCDLYMQIVKEDEQHPDLKYSLGLIKQQLMWIGHGHIADEKIQEHVKKETERCINAVIKLFQDSKDHLLHIEGKELSEPYIELKRELKKNMSIIWPDPNNDSEESKERKKFLRELGKNDRPLTDNQMKTISDLIGVNVGLEKLETNSGVDYKIII